jgi:glycosyltransferase involved in cell wall biosynthesis
MKPSISVVIPACNVAKYIGQALDSVLAQSFADWECIVVDDGSTDDTAARVEAFADPRIRLVRQENAGVSVARNVGLAAAAAEAVTFLDGDDAFHPTALARLHAVLAAHPEAILVFGTSMRMLPSAEIEPGQKPPAAHAYETGDINRAMLTHGRVFWNGGQILARTEAVRRAGGYTRGIRLSQDWEMFCRLTALGPCVFIGPQDEILRHRVHPESTVPRLSVLLDSHLPAIDAVFGNEVLRARYDPAEWRAMHQEVLANHTFECGRQNFIQRRFGEARKLMWRGIALKPSKRRVAIFALALASQAIDRPLVGVLRYNVRPAAE